MGIHLEQIGTNLLRSITDVILRLGTPLTILLNIVSGVAECACQQIDGRFFAFLKCLT